MKTDRRTALKIMGAAAVIPLLPNIPLVDPKRRINQEQRVIIDAHREWVTKIFGNYEGLYLSGISWDAWNSSKFSKIMHFSEVLTGSRKNYAGSLKYDLELIDPFNDLKKTSFNFTALRKTKHLYQVKSNSYLVIFGPDYEIHHSIEYSKKSLLRKEHHTIKNFKIWNKI